MIQQGRQVNENDKANATNRANLVNKASEAWPTNFWLTPALPWSIKYSSKLRLNDGIAIVQLFLYSLTKYSLIVATNKRCFGITATNNQHGWRSSCTPKMWNGNWLINIKHFTWINDWSKTGNQPVGLVEENGWSWLCSLRMQSRFLRS